MEDGVKLSQMKYGWTKWGGPRHGLVKHRGKWSCQICSREHPDSMPAYMFNVDNGDFREFIRVCAICHNTAKKKKIKKLQVLIRTIRVRKHWYDYVED